VEETERDFREKGDSLTYNITEIRSHFPSLQNGNIFFDNPGGTQVSQQVIDAVTTYYKSANSNTHGVRSRPRSEPTR
jgi:selenocysteine lyase/cysteine desulfurase